MKSNWLHQRTCAWRGSDGVYGEGAVLQVWKFYSARSTGIPRAGMATGDGAPGISGLDVVLGTQQSCLFTSFISSTLALAPVIRFTFARGSCRDAWLVRREHFGHGTRPGEVWPGAAGRYIPQPTLHPAPLSDSWRRFSVSRRTSPSPSPKYSVPCSGQ